MNFLIHNNIIVGGVFSNQMILTMIFFFFFSFNGGHIATVIKKEDLYIEDKREVHVDYMY